jgi:glycosyltransferase involved in cell wall biosynthesis
MQGISVVTITFNDSNGLLATASSLTDGIDEWIVIDGSTDPKSKLANQLLLKDRAAKLIQEPDNGRFDAMNKGLKLATRPIILFLNSGDSFSGTNVPRVIESIFSQENCIWAVGQVHAVNEKHEFQWRWPCPNHNSLKLRLGINSYCHQATAYQTEILRNLGGFEKDSLYSDWQTSLILSKIERPFVHDSIWSHFLVDGISSVQTVEYWESESHRLRMRAGVYIGKSRWLDFLAQKAAGAFIKSTRGRLIRPDLVKKYG